MKYFMLFLIILNIFICSLSLENFDNLKSYIDLNVQKNTVIQLIKRLIPDRAYQFEIKIDTTIGRYRSFKLENVKENSILITGSNGVAAAWGFHYYISQFCHCHVAWEGKNLELPLILPKLPIKGFYISSNDRFTYYQNVCTSSYSFVWYNWTQWENHIDWMALNSINLPLAFTAQEAIWQRVYRKLGFTQNEIDVFFTGPAFLAWSRMGNIHSWGGGLPQEWHDNQISLQHKILKRMRNFGMIPVLPAFNGIVPENISRLFPEIHVSILQPWNNFNASYCCSTLIDFEDPLFFTIGSLFLKEYISKFGTNHIYNTDTFNENQPKSSNLSYLSLAGQTVYKSMLSVDSKAIWLMQGWMFTDSFWKKEQAKALLTSIPKGRMIVLDLFAEVKPQYRRLESFYGQPFIWCMLHNFGGNNAMIGRISQVEKGSREARKYNQSSMVGIGLAPEGINQNYIIYDFMLENTWVKNRRNIFDWAKKYAQRRYGVSNDLIGKAWQILIHTVYNYTYSSTNENHKSIVHRPSLHLNYEPWYSIDMFMLSWDLFIQQSNNISNSYLFRFDLIDVTRQALELITWNFYNKLLLAYKEKNLITFKSNSSLLLSCLLDMDLLLGTDKHFLLGLWIQQARNMTNSALNKNIFEFNAKNQLTLWGPNANIVDYASKQWNGLFSSYYYQRWKLFIDYLLISWNTIFDENKFKLDVFDKVEKPFSYKFANYSTSPKGNPIDIAQLLYKKYRNKFY